MIFFYADLGPNYSKFRRDALLVIFMLLGSVGFILFVSTYSIFVLVSIVIPSLIAMWFLSSPLITNWIYNTISDQEVYENYLNDKKIITKDIINNYIINLPIHSLFHTLKALE